MLREEIKAITSSRRDLRNFGLVVGAGFLILGTVLLWREKTLWPYFGGIGLALALGGLLFPVQLTPLQRAWMTLAVIMGWFMTRVILTLLFFLVVTPIGIVARIAGKQFLGAPPAAGDASHWHRRGDEPIDPKHYERQF
jgi:hypothetical protein